MEPEGDEPDEDPEEEEKPEEDKGIHLEASLYSSRQMGLTILNRLGVTEPKPPVDTPREPETPPAPVIDLDGKTEDGSMPFNILMKQLELMH